MTHQVAAKLGRGHLSPALPYALPVSRPFCPGLSIPQLGLLAGGPASPSLMLSHVFPSKGSGTLMASTGWVWRTFTG